jgi:hypothetical protein
MTKRLIAIALMGVCARLVAASLPFVGRWKLDAAKSDPEVITVTFTEVAPGEWRMSQAGVGLTSTFKIDGTDYPAPFGRTATWKQMDAHTFEETEKQQGNVIEISTFKLSPDNQTLTVSSKRADTGARSTINFVRASEGKGLVGTWRGKSASASEVWEIEPNGQDGVTIRFIGLNAGCTVRFDGKDYPMTGASAPSRMTLAAERVGDRGIKLTQKSDGKILFVNTLTATADGKRLEGTSEMGSGPERRSTRIVFDRQ